VTATNPSKKIKTAYFCVGLPNVSFNQILV